MKDGIQDLLFPVDVRKLISFGISGKSPINVLENDACARTSIVLAENSIDNIFPRTLEITSTFVEDSLKTVSTAISKIPKLLRHYDEQHSNSQCNKNWKFNITCKAQENLDSDLKANIIINLEVKTAFDEIGSHVLVEKMRKNRRGRNKQRGGKLLLSIGNR
ncbi:hypothetical protein ACFE04_020688 [Oxalis oulophora]